LKKSAVPETHLVNEPSYVGFTGVTVAGVDQLDVPETPLEKLPPSR
jgi:hypothetical protein